eukprot:528840-Rhodomonas_salina.1
MSDTAIGQTWKCFAVCLHQASRCPVLWTRRCVCSGLQARYDMSGADIAHGGFQTPGCAQLSRSRRSRSSECHDAYVRYWQSQDLWAWVMTAGTDRDLDTEACTDMKSVY